MDSTTKQTKVLAEQGGYRVIYLGKRMLTLHLPDLGSAKKNAQLDALLQQFARRLIAIMLDEK